MCEHIGKAVRGLEAGLQHGNGNLFECAYPWAGKSVQRVLKKGAEFLSSVHLKQQEGTASIFLKKGTRRSRGPTSSDYLFIFYLIREIPDRYYGVKVSRTK